MKRLLCFLLVLVMACSLSGVAFAEGKLENFVTVRSYKQGQFTDVPETAWYAESVKSAYETGLVNGATETTFNPDGDITVAETVTLAARIHSAYNANGYEFRQEGAAWYQTYVDYAVENSIIGAGDYTDYTQKCSRLNFASIIAASVPKSEFAKINNIEQIPDVDMVENDAKSEAVYMLYNAGILTGSDEYGTFNPEASIKRSEVSAILARITDVSQRKTFTPTSTAANDGAKSYEHIFQYGSPVIDFSNDDGTMSELHLELRLMFEQSALPEALFEYSEELDELIVNEPEAFLAFVDDEIWASCMSTIAIRYMSDSEEEFLIANEEDIVKHIGDISDRFSLHAYEHYEADGFKFDDDTYCILLNMADIGDELKADETDKMSISSFVAIVYDDKVDAFSYYLLERSFDGYHMLCSYDKDGTHQNFGSVEKDKRAFVESIEKLLSE